MWDRIEPLMPADPVRGRRWADHRRTIEAIAWKYRTGSPWRGLSAEFGSFKTAHQRLLRCRSLIPPCDARSAVWRSSGVQAGDVPGPSAAKPCA